MRTSDPEPFDARHIALGERMTHAWLCNDKQEAHAVFDEILRRPDDLVIVFEYLIGAVAVERIERVGRDQAMAETQAVIAELSEDVQPGRRAHLIRIKQYDAAG